MVNGATISQYVFCDQSSRSIAKVRKKRGSLKKYNCYRYFCWRNRSILLYSARPPEITMFILKFSKVCNQTWAGEHILVGFNSRLLHALVRAALAGHLEEEGIRALRNQVLKNFSWCGLSLPSLPVQSLPPLEWPLSSQSGSYELRIEVQPKPHHRAHYETEGSRGAVKAPTGGHPVVQVRDWRTTP